MICEKPPTEDELIEKYSYIARTESVKYSTKKGFGVISYDDCLASSYYGMINAIRSYESGKNKKLSSWITGKVVFQIINDARKQNQIVRSTTSYSHIKTISYDVDDDTKGNFIDQLTHEVGMPKGSLTKESFNSICKHLRSNEARVIKLRFMEGLLCREIAAIENININVVMRNVRESIQKIKELNTRDRILEILA